MLVGQMQVKRNCRRQPEVTFVNESMPNKKIFCIGINHVGVIGQCFSEHIRTAARDGRTTTFPSLGEQPGGHGLL